MTNSLSTTSPAYQFLTNTFNLSKPVTVTKENDRYIVSNAQLITRCALTALTVFAASFVILGSVASGVIISAFVFVKFAQNEHAKTKNQIETLKNIETLFAAAVNPTEYNKLANSDELFTRFVNDGRFNANDTNVQILKDNFFEKWDFSFQTRVELGQKLHILLGKGVAFTPKQIIEFTNFCLTHKTPGFDAVVNLLEKHPDIIKQFNDRQMKLLLTNFAKVDVATKSDLITRLINVITKNQCQTTVNAALEHMLGRTSSELVTNHMSEVIYNLIAFGNLDTTQYEVFEQDSLSPEITKALEEGNAMRESILRNPQLTANISAIAKIRTRDLIPDLYSFTQPSIEINQYEFRVKTLDVKFRAITALWATFSVPFVVTSSVSLPILAAAGIAGLLTYKFEHYRATNTLFKYAVEELKEFKPYESALSYIIRTPNVLNKLMKTHPNLIKNHKNALLKAFFKFGFEERRNISKQMQQLRAHFKFVVASFYPGLSDDEKVEFIIELIHSGLTPLIEDFAETHPLGEIELTDSQQHVCWISAQNKKTLSLLKKAGLNPNVKSANGQTPIEYVYHHYYTPKILRLTGEKFELYEFIEAMLCTAEADIDTERDGEGKSIRDRILADTSPISEKRASRELIRQYKPFPAPSSSSSSSS